MKLLTRFGFGMNLHIMPMCCQGCEPGEEGGEDPGGDSCLSCSLTSVMPRGEGDDESGGCDPGGEDPYADTCIKCEDSPPESGNDDDGVEDGCLKCSRGLIGSHNDDNKIDETDIGNTLVNDSLLHRILCSDSESDGGGTCDSGGGISGQGDGKGD